MNPIRIPIATIEDENVYQSSGDNNTISQYPQTYCYNRYNYNCPHPSLPNNNNNNSKSFFFRKRSHNLKGSTTSRRSSLKYIASCCRKYKPHAIIPQTPIIKSYHFHGSSPTCNGNYIKSDFIRSLSSQLVTAAAASSVAAKSIVGDSFGGASSSNGYYYGFGDDYKLELQSAASFSRRVNDDCQITTGSSSTLASHFEENKWDYNFAIRGLYLSQPWARNRQQQQQQQIEKEEEEEETKLKESECETGITTVTIQPIKVDLTKHPTYNNKTNPPINDQNQQSTINSDNRDETDKIYDRMECEFEDYYA
jgi:hypothetical protein